MSPTQLPAAKPATREIRYDGTTILLHWTTAALVLLQWGLAHIIDWFPRGEPRIAPRSAHILIGVLLAFIVLLRAVWRSSKGRRLATADPGFAGLSARIVHYGLYLLLLATLALGFWFEWLRGDSLFGLITLSNADAEKHELRGTIGALHNALANSVLIVAGLHAAAALAHHYVLKDGTLRRMLPPKLFPDRR